MPHTKSATKRMRQNEQRRLRNRGVRSILKTQIKKFLEAVEARNPEVARAQLRLTTRVLDKDAARGIIHWRTAARKKSRLTKKLHKLLSGAAHPPEAGKPQESA